MKLQISTSILNLCRALYARANRDERERQRVHAAELATEKRRAEIREAAAKGLIAQAAAEEMLGENRQTLILRLASIKIKKVVPGPFAKRSHEGSRERKGPRNLRPITAGSVLWENVADEAERDKHRAVPFRNAHFVVLENNSWANDVA